MIERALVSLEKELAISPNQILTISSNFQAHMNRGLSGGLSSLKMFPSYLNAPSGRESGTFLALDFGGSNVRASVVSLQGTGHYEESSRLSRPLFDPKSGRDFRSAAATAEELFDFLAGVIQDVLNPSLSGPLPLGFTFSFPYHQRRIDEGVLLHWNKEVKTSGVVGKNVGRLLWDALVRRGLMQNVRPSAIINDTVAAYLTAAYLDPSVDMASIIGTGHNTCYLEPKDLNFKFPVIINTESGNFCNAPETSYDRRLDQNSHNPGEQLFEKKLSGKYLGELFRLIVLDFSQRGLLNKLNLSARWNCPYTISGKDLALIITEKAEPGIDAAPMSRSDGFALQQIAQLLLVRSARLAAASLIGIVHHLDPHLEKPHTVAIDGSLYEKMPGYAQMLTDALAEGLGNKTDLINIKLSAGGSLTGAAIAAALAKQM